MEEKKSLRKISVGKDYLNAMHFQVGSFANRKRDLIISDIIMDSEGASVYAKKNDLVQEWKWFKREAITHYELKLVD